jgi:hypothetical protein
MSELIYDKKENTEQTIEIKKPTTVKNTTVKTSTSENLNEIIQLVIDTHGG